MTICTSMVLSLPICVTICSSAPLHLSKFLCAALHPLCFYAPLHLWSSLYPYVLLCTLCASLHRYIFLSIFVQLCIHMHLSALLCTSMRFYIILYIPLPPEVAKTPRGNLGVFLVPKFHFLFTKKNHSCRNSF